MFLALWFQYTPDFLQPKSSSCRLPIRQAVFNSEAEYWLKESKLFKSYVTTEYCRYSLIIVGTLGLKTKGSYDY